ncbi:MAG: type II secretion system F family protein [Planctomycetes bacterium]|nr:type II secretion system F family protein [Planctomycetota bacterium]
MSRFLCRVTRPDGTESEMTVEAESVATAVDEIVAQSLHITSLVQLDPPAALPPGDLTHDPVSLFATGLSRLLQSGLPLPQALRTLASDASSRRFARELETLAQEVESGKSLADALKQRQRRFSPLFVNLVAIGERAGRLTDMMPLLVRHLSLHATMQRRLFEAFLYPGIAILFTIGLLLFHRAFIMPQYAQIYDSMKIPLPLLSVWVIGFMRFLPWLVLGGALAVMGAGVLGGTAPGRSGPLAGAWDFMLGLVPFVGRFRRSAQISGFCSGLGTLLYGGVPADQALAWVSDLMLTRRGRLAVQTLREQALSGAPLSDALSSLPFFPKTLGWIASAGESRGHLPSALLEAATLYEQDAEYAVVLLQTFLPPIAIVVVAIVLAVVAIAVNFLPLLGLMGAF